MTAKKYSYETRGTRYFGMEVKRLREKRGWAQAQLVAMGSIRLSGGFVGQIERGTRRARRELAGALDEVFEIDDLVRIWDELIKEDDYMPDYFATYKGVGKIVTCTLQYAPTLVPGLLQTPEYARAIFQAGWPPHSEAEIETGRSADRESYSPGRSRRSRCVVHRDEEVLHSMIGAAAGMRRQLAYILESVPTRRLAIQVIPFTCTSCAALEGPLLVLEFADAPPTAYTESQGTSRLLDDAADVKLRRTVFDQLRSIALTPEASVEFIKDVMKGHV